MKLTIASTTTLSNGVKMPLLGLGTYKAAEGAEVEREVLEALEVGYRSIDTASMYDNEAGIGRALRASGVPRSQLFLATKVWNDEQGHEETLAAFERSAERLGTDYLDLYLVHWPHAGLYAETWRAFEELYHAGRVRAIGVCNFLTPHLEGLRAVAQIGPMVNQVEFHPRLQQPDLQLYCAEHAIVIEAWAPLMRGRVFEEPVIVSIADRYGVTPAQVTLRWLLQKGIVAIPKSVRPERIRANADVFSFELAPEDVRRMDDMDAGERLGRHPDSWGLGQR